ncbi:MAG: MipA/OmpV family protein [Kiritimatiellae bacterium]|nr:MipA/OmpV family protein [Kiritimatiellia bacterium]MDD4736649.1 MipA/OmpV family protein [Kiritimatiellia bacterium]
MKIKGTVCMGLLALASIVRAESEITVDYGSSYIWRGQVLNSAAVVQPGMTVSTPIGLYLNAWGNMDATKKNELAGKFTEVDLTAGYSLPLEGMVSMDIGAINYLFPYNSEQGEGGVDETTEVFASIGLDVILAPTLAVYYDVDEVKGAYVNAGIGYSYAATEAVSLDAGLSIGWGSSKYNESYFDEDESRFNDAQASIGASYALAEGLSIGAKVAYSYLLDSTIRDNAEAIYGQKANTYAGLSLAYAF